MTSAEEACEVPDRLGERKNVGELAYADASCSF